MLKNLNVYVTVVRTRGHCLWIRTLWKKKLYITVIDSSYMYSLQHILKIFTVKKSKNSNKQKYN